MKRAARLATAIALGTALANALPSRTALCAEPMNDARKLYTEGQPNAAAAVYEDAWRRDHRPFDGINAVVAWRRAGKYAHARTLLASLRESSALPPEIVERASLMDERLSSLTGQVVLAGDAVAGDAAKNVVVLVDAAPPERLDGDIAVDVGIRTITVDKPGCDRFEWRGVVRPRQRIEIPVRFECRRLPGSVHVGLATPGALVRIDRHWVKVDEHDYAESLPPGQHELVVIRRGIEITNQSFELEPRESKNFDVGVPWRAKISGLVAGAAASTIAATNGPTAGAGIGFGYLRGFEPDARVRAASLELIVLLGVASSGVGTEEAGPRPWFGFTTGVRRILPPLWSARSGKFLFALDFDPAIGTMQVAPVSRPSRYGGLDETSRVLYVGTSPFTLTADLPFLHSELALYPIGFVAHTPYAVFVSDAPTKLTHAMSIGLLVGDVFFGH